MSIQTFPIDLPYDVERTLIESAVYHDRELAKKLVGLTKEVREWVDPILYRHVKIEYPAQAEAFIRTLENSSKDPEFFARHVRILCFAYGISLEQVGKILTRCTKVKSLASWIEFSQNTNAEENSANANTNTNTNTNTKKTLHPEELQQFIMNESSHLRRLSIILQDFFGTPDPDFTLPVLQNLTHLDIYQGSEHFRTWTWNGFKDLVQLTHLSFDLSIASSLDIIGYLIPFLPKNLQVCLVLLSTREATITLGEFFKGNTELERCIKGEYDRRVVIGTTEDLWKELHFDGLVVVHPYEDVVKDWTYIPDGKDDIWDKAIAVVERRDMARREREKAKKQENSRRH